MTSRQPTGTEYRALAKLTLSLRVTGVRADGYHELESEMVNLDLADSLYFLPGDGLEVCDGGAGTGGFGLGSVPADGTNLVSRALALCGRTARVRLVKRIPAGAGLGGGSADAAAVLRWAGFAGPDGPPTPGLAVPRGLAALEAAAKLGSDVPFCLAGGGRALVSGAGERLQPLPFEEVSQCAYTLVLPPFGVPTGAVYAAWDAMGGPTGQGAGTNDLEAPALLVEPRLAQWRDRLGEATGEQPVLAGSGSTWFVPGEYPGPGRIVARTARPYGPS